MAVTQQPVQRIEVLTLLQQYHDTPLDTRRDLVIADQHQAFYLQQASALYSLIDLRDELEFMSPEEYGHHVSAKKNDFADWVEQVLDDPACAAALKRCKKPLSARRVVIKFLRNYRIPPTHS